MKKNPYFINVILGVVTGLVCLAGLITRAFFPAVILPRIDIPVFVAISAFSCAVAYYVNQGMRDDKFGSALLAGLTFSILPFCAGLTFGFPIWKLFIIGALVFLFVDFCYEAIGKRMETGAFGKMAPLANAFVLFLASQCFQGIFF